MGITVLLADSVVDVRLLQKEPDIEVVGEAADEPEAMMLIKSLEPQIVLTDFNVRSTGKIFAKQSKSNQISTPKNKDSRCDRTQGKVR
jgi:DNA-binding NarL/FixJ family response regulator